jgi:hypothetical protein
MIRKIAAAVGISAALALGAAGVVSAAGWGDPSTPVLTATASGTAPNCSYTVTASVTGWPGASDQYDIGVELSYWTGGGLGQGQQVVVLGANAYGAGVPLTQLNPADVWSTTSASPEGYAYSLSLVSLVTYQPSGTALGVAIYLPGDYSGSCGVEATAPPTDTPAAPPTDTPAPTAAPSGDATAPPTAIPVGTGSQGVPSGSGGSQVQGQATLPPTGSASSTATPGAATTDTPSATASPTATPNPTPDAGLAPASAHTPTSGGDGLMLILLVAAFFVVCGAAAFGGAYLRRRSA